jgi:hypothetical protein
MLEENSYQNHASFYGILGGLSKFFSKVLTIEK